MSREALLVAMPAIANMQREASHMFTYQLAGPEQTEEFLQLLRIDAADYLERTAQLMQMTWPQFAELVKTVGRVYGVYQDSESVGFYWIEERGKVVH